MATAIGVEVRRQECVHALDSALERAKTGDEDAFQELVDSVSPEFPPCQRPVRQIPSLI